MKLEIALAIGMAGLFAIADTQVVDSVTGTYQVNEGKVESGNVLWKEGRADVLKFVHKDDTSHKGFKEMLQEFKKRQSTIEGGKLDEAELRKLRERQRELLLKIQAELKKERADRQRK